MACRRQAIIRTNVGILLIELLGINFSEILIQINTFSFKKMHLKMSSAKCRLFRLGLIVLTSTLVNDNHTLIIVSIVSIFDSRSWFNFPFMANNPTNLLKFSAWYHIDLIFFCQWMVWLVLTCAQKWWNYIVSNFKFPTILSHFRSHFEPHEFQIGLVGSTYLHTDVTSKNWMNTKILWNYILRSTIVFKKSAFVGMHLHYTS